ncbi:MAG: trypsin-like peptidase domain-containing protein [Saprospiraceae bacterium]|nr:trypsin-like peptidase domain-containing protein [Saprospiraceae bacterium]
MIIIVLLAIAACSHPTHDQAVRPYHNAWVSSPLGEWPPIAMINEVWYQDSQRYVHPSFDYAGTGFLIDTGTDTLAATAKHVLWIARHRAMRTVNPNPWLQQWIMRPKGNLQDSVVIDQLINADTSELLQGRGASIQERDWLVFTTSYVSPDIQPLRPAYRQLQPGEQIYFAACPYRDSTCVTGHAEVLMARGNRIVFSQEDTAFDARGASGSPLLDSAGYLVGIFGGTSVDTRNGGEAFYGISTHYLKKVLENDPAMNRPLIPIGEHFLAEAARTDFDRAFANLQLLVTDEQAYFTYSLSPEEFIDLAADYKDQDSLEQAARIARLGLSVHPGFSRSHSFLGVIHAKAGRPDSARAAFVRALELWPGNEEARGGLGTLD